MQKLISSLIYIICLMLLSVASINYDNQTLAKLPLFQAVTPVNIESKTITAKSLGITTSATTPSALHAKASCLMDGDTGQILYADNATESMPMASTTKIMTCIIILENGNLNDTVTTSEYAASMPDVQLGMQKGEKFKLKDLIYSLMLESHNDTAVAIAEHIGGSVEGFAELMNEKAEELGCTNTHFVTPNGLDDDEHYTSAKDLCRIACYAIQNKKFCKIIKTASHSFSNCEGTRSYCVSNKDAFLSSYNGAIGIKTGFTGNAGYCFCGAAKRNGITLVSAVLACGWPPNKSYKWQDTTALMNYGFEKYKKIKIAPDSKLPKLTITNGQSTKLAIKRTIPDTFAILLTAGDTVSVTYELPDSLSAPVRAGDIIGYENYLLNGSLYCQIPLVAMASVNAADQNYYQNILYKLFFIDI